jgi:hypothetical protein
LKKKAPVTSAGAFLVCCLFLLELDMWKLVVGFIIFAALALYMLSRGGDIDLGGEKHGAVTTQMPRS